MRWVELHNLVKAYVDHVTIETMIIRLMLQHGQSVRELGTPSNFRKL